MDQPCGADVAAISRREPSATLTRTVPNAGARVRRRAVARRAAGAVVREDGVRWQAKAAGEKPVRAEARARASGS